MSAADLIALAERCEAYGRRIEAIANSSMPASAQATSLALLSAMKGVALVDDCAAALRARAAQEGDA